MISTFYAIAFGILFIALSVKTLRTRRRCQIAVGDGGNLEMLRAVRVHGNFTEYTPFALLLIFMLEFLWPNAIVINALCITLLAGRLSHAWGVSEVQENFRFRVIGMGLTFTAIMGACLGLLYANLALLQ